MQKIEEDSRQPWSLDAEALLRHHGSSRLHGLTTQQVHERRIQYGANELVSTAVLPAWKIFIKQFKNPMVLTLLAASSVSIFIGEVLDASAILLILIINATIGFVQEKKSIQAMEELKKLSAPKVRVIRNGSDLIIPSEEVVPGDIIQVEAGDLVSADARLIEGSQLSADEASLTGESLPITKENMILPSSTPMADRVNMLHSGTAISSGSGYAVVTHTGMATEMGSIAGLLNQDTSVKTPLERKLDKVTRNLIFLGLVVICAVIVIRLREGSSVLEIMMASISLAVAAIPEGLPTVVSLALMLAVHRMTKRNALVRNLSSVEALGSVDVICTDKTGTLTAGVMTVSGHYLLPGKQEEMFFNAITLCNNAAIAGDSTEIALFKHAEASGFDPSGIRDKFQRLQEWTFESIRKRMSVLVEDKEKRKWVFTKGAPETMITTACNPPEDIRILQEKISEFSSKGYRLLIVGYKEGSANTEQEAESELTLLGIVVISDPPRKETIPAIKECQRAGIRVVMITGDHALTARAIASELGIITKENAVVMTGKELDELNDTELASHVEKVAVFARVTPAHKLKIIDGLRKNGHSVAMTGDGVNDAPALKNADIGIAMGKGGTEVARKASGIVLADDNFATIVSAVEEGRGVYNNIRQTVRYLLSTNLAEILIVLGASIAGLQVPFNPMGLLWINLVTDGLPSLGLASEPLDKNVLADSSTPNPESFFDRKYVTELITMGILITIIGLGMYSYLAGLGDKDYARSCAFSLLVFICLSMSLACRSETKTIFELKPNYFLLITVVVTLILHVMLQRTALFREVFDVNTLSFKELMILFLISLLPPSFSEVIKIIKRKLV